MSIIVSRPLRGVSVRLNPLRGSLAHARRRGIALAAAAALPVAALLAAPAAHAQLTPAPSGVLSLSAQSSVDVPEDVIDITLFYEQESQDPSGLTATLNQHAEAALSRARNATGISAHTGQFSISPSTDRDGKISAWRGRVEVVLESRDFGAASKLATQMGADMQVGQVSFSLSPDAQHVAERKLTDQALASFRERAEAGARALGYSGYTIREVNVGSARSVQPFRPMMMAMAKEAAPAPLAVEGGKATVTVNVNGSVQMK